MKINIFMVIIYSFVLLSGLSASASTASDITAGNKLYEQKQYDKAIEEYSKAEDEGLNADILSFNKGTALYKQGKYKEALDAFTNSLITEDKGIEAMANYNIANTEFRLGSDNINGDLSKAIQLYKQSLDHYKRSVELDENNDDARYNHELVEKRVKVLLDQQKNQPEQEKEKEQKKDKEDKGDEQEGEEQQSGGSDKEQSKEEQETEGDRSGDDEQDKETGQEQSSQEEKTDSGDSADTGEEEVKGQEMTPEEANMLLEAFGEEESLDSLEKQGKARFRGVIKNW